MIKFKTIVERVWVNGTDKAFDNTELKLYSAEKRETLAFLLMPRTPAKQKEIRESAKKVVDTQNITIEKMMGGGDYDEELIKRETLDYIIQGWKGVLKEDGSPMPCTIENKLAIFDGGYKRLGGAIVDVSDWLIAKHEQYNQEEKKADLGNSETSQDGLNKED